MGIQYDFYQNPPQEGDEAKPKLHARVKPAGTVGMEEVCELIHHFSSLSTADMKGAIDALANILELKLTAGYRVHLEGLGTFGLTLTCPPVDKPNEIRAESVKVKSVVFRPEKAFVKRVKGSAMVRVRDKNHTRSQADEEMDAHLDAWFAKQPTLTGKQFCGLCGFTRTTGHRRLKQLLADGRLRATGHWKAPLYVPGAVTGR